MAGVPEPSPIPSPSGVRKPSRRRRAGKRELKCERLARKAAASPQSATGVDRDGLSECGDGSTRLSRKAVESQQSAAGVERDGESECLVEGSVRFSAAEGVFFSRSQEANRSLSVRVLIAFGQTYGPLSVLEAMCGTGVRACRYAMEAGPVTNVTANDLNSRACDCARANAVANGIGAKVQVGSLTACLGSRVVVALCHKVPRSGAQPHLNRMDIPCVERTASCTHQVCCTDATELMSARPSTFDVVEIDPSGSPAKVIPSALCAVRSGGLLCVNAFDMHVLCGIGSVEAALKKYAARPVTLGAVAREEGAIRLLLGFVHRQAAAAQRWIEPLLCVFLDYHVRLFVRVHHCTTPSHVALANPLRFVRTDADGQLLLHEAAADESCGPIWAMPYIDKQFVVSVLGALAQPTIELLFEVLNAQHQRMASAEHAVFTMTVL